MLVDRCEKHTAGTFVLRAQIAELLDVKFGLTYNYDSASLISSGFVLHTKTVFSTRFSSSTDFVYVASKAKKHLASRGAMLLEAAKFNTSHFNDILQTSPANVCC
jgi:hypothetical protein